jgi:uncharacterized membrane protein YecN with MAPEG domain
MISASLLGLLLIYLSFITAKTRGATKTDLGDGGHPEMLRAIRAQGNLTEYAPLGLILIGLLEYRGTNEWLLIALASFFVVGRFMHGLTLGKMSGRNPFRFLGTIFTWLAIVVASVTGLLQVFVF